jgi:hypothetical protein
VASSAGEEVGDKEKIGGRGLLTCFWDCRSFWSSVNLPGAMRTGCSSDAACFFQGQAFLESFQDIYNRCCRCACLRRSATGWSGPPLDDPAGARLHGDLVTPSSADN